jgi:hypothetical protein
MGVAVAAAPVATLTLMSGAVAADQYIRCDAAPGSTDWAWLRGIGWEPSPLGELPGE